jgi:hypothetical protein
MHRRTAVAVVAVMMLAVPSEGVAQERVTLRILTGSQPPRVQSAQLSGHAREGD